MGFDQDLPRGGIESDEEFLHGLHFLLGRHDDELAGSGIGQELVARRIKCAFENRHDISRAAISQWKDLGEKWFQSLWILDGHF